MVAAWTELAYPFAENSYRRRAAAAAGGSGCVASAGIGSMKESGENRNQRKERKYESRKKETN